MKYCERTFLSPLTHSSAYVMCYYDLTCPNEWYRNFVRIADCRKSYDICCGRSIKTFCKTLSNIVDVIEGRRISYTFGTLTRRHKIERIFYEAGSNYIAAIKVTMYFSNKFKKSVPSKDIVIASAPYALDAVEEMLYLHADKSTCSLVEWERKTKILADEIKKFIDFLNTLS